MNCFPIERRKGKGCHGATVLLPRKFVKLHTMSTIFSLSRQTFRLIFLFPLSLLALQGFDLVSELVLYYIDDPQASRLFYAVGFPIVWFMTVFATAATFDFIRQHHRGVIPSVGSALTALGARLWSMSKTELIAGLAVMMGLLIVLPGLYFLTVYLFVPCFVMTLPPSSAFTYLAESKQLTRGRFWPLFILSVCIIALSVGLNELQNIWDTTAESVLGRVLPRTFFSLALSAAINTFISVCFFHFTEIDACSTPLPNGSTK